MWRSINVLTLATGIAIFQFGCHSDAARALPARVSFVLPEKPEVLSPYAPQLSVEKRLEFVEGAPVLTVYRFSDEQLERMDRTKLDTNRFVAYIEKKWTVERLQAYCVRSNLWSRGYQNLVPSNCPIDAEIHQGRNHGFDRITVYVSEDDGRGEYVESAGWNWHRWNYSVNINRKRDHWAIVEVLPNDFMDSSENGIH